MSSTRGKRVRIDKEYFPRQQNSISRMSVIFFSFIFLPLLLLLLLLLLFFFYFVCDPLHDDARRSGGVSVNVIATVRVGVLNSSYLNAKRLGIERQTGWKAFVRVQ